MTAIHKYTPYTYSNRINVVGYYTPFLICHSATKKMLRRAAYRLGSSWWAASSCYPTSSALLGAAAHNEQQHAAAAQSSSSAAARRARCAISTSAAPRQQPHASALCAGALGLSPEQLEFQDVASQFAAEHLAPHSARWDEESHFPVDTLRAAAALGFGAMYVPEALGGAGLTRAGEGKRSFGLSPLPVCKTVFVRHSMHHTLT
jgi:hypothetical protein